MNHPAIRVAEDTSGSTYVPVSVPYVETTEPKVPNCKLIFQPPTDDGNREHGTVTKPDRRGIYL